MSSRLALHHHSNPPLGHVRASRDVNIPKGFEQVRHVLVIYMENWSFNGQFGLFPGANGIAKNGIDVPTPSLMPSNSESHALLSFCLTPG